MFNAWMSAQERSLEGEKKWSSMAEAIGLMLVIEEARTKSELHVMTPEGVIRV